jgi:hypothetical protein
MGTIKPKGNGVIVEFTVDEMILQRAIVSLPTTPPPDKSMIFSDYIGNFISRAAYLILLRNTMKYVKEYNRVKVEGTGVVKVTFWNEEE